MGGWHNPHVQYAPLGYTFNASNYCLSCISQLAVVDMGGKTNEECACPEHTLDLWATHKGIGDRYDESSFDSADFPKCIRYHDACQLTCEDMGCERTDDHEHHELCESCGEDICQG